MSESAIGLVTPSDSGAPAVIADAIPETPGQPMAAGTEFDSSSTVKNVGELRAKAPELWFQMFKG